MCHVQDIAPLTQNAKAHTSEPTAKINVNALSHAFYPPQLES